MQNNAFSVSEVNKYIKGMFASDYCLGSITVKGEVSNLKYHSSGHIYFTLKDEKSAIKAVMFASSRASGLKFKMVEGMLVAAKGSVEVFERDGTYQLYAKEITEDGVGDLYRRFEELKASLSQQGMFDPQYKRPIPRHVKTLGVVTAPTGAAVRDIINVSQRRNPGISIVLYPAIVQGPEAPLSIIKGIQALDAYGVDVMIVGRGGGSIEDLWGFNDEGVANAIFNASVPVVSAVGHETDFTIADFVSDLRAPTPSAAAELCVSDVYTDLKRIEDYKAGLNKAMSHSINDARKNTVHFEESLRAMSPKARVHEYRERLENAGKNLYREISDCIKLRRTHNDTYLRRLNDDIDNICKNARHKYELLAGRLDADSPLKRISAGYAYVKGPDDKALKSVKRVNTGDSISVSVIDGTIAAKVTCVETEES